jgi:hypothetical protein
MSDLLVIVGCAGMVLSIAVKLIVVQCLRARGGAEQGAAPASAEKIDNQE